MKEQKLCALNKEYGTLDLWVNNEEHWKFGNEETTWQIIATYNGKDPKEGEAYRITLDKKPTEALDALLGYIGRETENWGFKDIVIHWGVHTWKFVNDRNITEIEKDENVKSIQDIQYFYDVEW